MTIQSGRMFGPYEILSLLGAGGMGEVYRARDTRLQRSVAIKVLPTELHADERVRARFDREAQAISSLSHPNICALFDVGHSDGVDYLVMEYLEGESLSDRIARGPLPNSLLLRYGAQIAEGLQQAHRAGVTHRDLKPGNIMITGSGVKILDFGLAKVAERQRVFSDRSAPETIVRDLTEEGTIVGTTPYMSPEQLLGKPLDARTDIFSFGIVLYEMATGKRPFPTTSTAACVAAILASDPIPMRSLQPTTLPALERIILTALEKNPEDRWQTAHDMGRQLRWLGESASGQEPAAVAPRRRLPAALWITGIVLVAAMLGWAGSRFFQPALPKQERVSLLFAFPPDVRPVNSLDVNAFAIAPDGTSVVLVASGGGPPSLYLRRLDSFALTKIAGTEGASGPFWSSDGQWIGFSSAGKMRKTRISGDAPPVVICNVTPNGTRATWQGDTILFADFQDQIKVIHRVAAGGGKPVAVTRLPPGEWTHTWPVLLPDGRHFLYHALTVGMHEQTLFLASLDSPERVALAKNISFARMGGPDRLVFVRDGSLLTQRFDLHSGASLGDPELVATDIAFFLPSARADFDASPTGAIVYRTNTSKGRLAVMDRQGTVTRTIDDQNRFWDHDLSPDGKRVVATVVAHDTGLMGLWIYDLVRGVRERFTSEETIEVSPAWSPDGRSIIYSQAEGGAFPHLVRRAVAGNMRAEELLPRGPFQFFAAVSPDGKAIYYENEAGKGQDIFRYTQDTKTTAPFLQTPFSESAPAVSPDGAWLAYSSNPNGTDEIYVQSLTSAELDPIRISTSGGQLPKWRGDSKELFYLASPNAMMSAVPTIDGQWAGEVRLSSLFEIPDLVRHFTASRDGQSFVIATEKKG
ncbi:MAG: protein kinase, partial [Acidobacteriota bacterium]